MHYYERFLLLTRFRLGLLIDIKQKLPQAPRAFLKHDIGLIPSQVVPMHRQQPVDPRMTHKLRFGQSVLKEETAESYFRQMGLVLVGGVYLFYRVSPPRLNMPALPDHRESAFA